MKINRIILFYSILSALCDGKRATGKFTVYPQAGERRTHYLTQFGCSIGTCNYRVRTWIEKPLAKISELQSMGVPVAQPDEAWKRLAAATPVSTQLKVFLDDDWLSATKIDCNSVSIARGTLNLPVPLSGRPGDWIQGAVEQKVRPHFWYFVLDDCSNRVMITYSRIVGVPSSFVNNLTVGYEIEFFQTDGTGLSHEHVGMMKWIIIQVVANCFMLAYALARQHKIMKRQEFHLHVIPQTTNFAILSSIAGGVFQLVYLSKLTHHATGSTFDALSQICFQLSHIAISIGLILIGLGVTLNVKQRISPGTGALIGVFISVLHILVVSFDIVTTDTRYKHFFLEGTVGWLICFMRCALWIAFLIGWNGTVNSPSIPYSTKAFLGRVVVPASLFFLSFPFLYVTLFIWRAHWRHAVLYNASFIIQCIAILMLGETFMRKGEYFKVSTMSQSFLPGGVWKPGALYYAE